MTMIWKFWILTWKINKRLKKGCDVRVTAFSVFWELFKNPEGQKLKKALRNGNIKKLGGIYL